MKSYLKTKDFSVTQEAFELLYDAEHDMLVTNPAPKELDRYYASDEYISHTDADRGLFAKAYQRVKKYSLKKKLSLINKFSNGEKTLLDMGSGTGDFLLAAKKRNWSTVGVEPNEMARKKSLDKGVGVETTLDNLGVKQFQIITLWHVLEHLSDLDGSIAKLNSLLNEKGTLVIAVPNFKSHDAKYYKEYWAAYDVPRHLWHFSKNSIVTIFSKHGFELIKTKPMWFDAFYVSILSEKYKERNFAFLRGVLRGFYSNIGALVSKECSSQIYILKKT